MKNENFTISKVSLRRAIDFFIIPSVLMVKSNIILVILLLIINALKPRAGDFSKKSLRFS